MSISQTTLETYLTEAVTAVGNSDFGTARTKLMQADIVLAGMPDHQIGIRRINYRMQIDGIMGRIDALEAKSTAVRKNNRVFAMHIRE
jgi:hypothetical protein